MFTVRGMPGILRKFNRNNDESDEIYTDQNYEDLPVKLCPYNEDTMQVFGKYSHPEATGYYIVHRWVDVQVGDQVIFPIKKDGAYTDNDIKTVLKVNDSWIFNRQANKILAVK